MLVGKGGAGALIDRFNLFAFGTRIGKPV